MADSDAQLDLKKRARRRLVGAVALALAAAIILPMVMESSPKPTGNDLQIRIPSQEGGNYASRLITGSPPPAPTADAPEEIDSDESAPAAVPPAPVAAASSSRSSIASVTPVPTNTPRYADASGPLVSPSGRPVPNAVAQQSQAASSKASSSRASASKSSAQAESRPGTHTGDADRARAILEGGVAPTNAAASSAAHFFVQLGVYRDADNAKSVQSRAKAAGFAVSTEKAGESTRVRVGPFATRAAADSAQGKLKQAGLSGVVTAK
ncbi:SPOR domain-containing protein [Uliginosibacterium sp. sgz301328]|uniref:SPOR domain-containing protein n=1 Tax=Uliginosibacterium sp. sgz301328 TaxID=3243764 RepID=UPI00359E06E7